MNVQFRRNARFTQPGYQCCLQLMPHLFCHVTYFGEALPTILLIHRKSKYSRKNRGLVIRNQNICPCKRAVGFPAKTFTLLCRTKQHGSALRSMSVFPCLFWKVSLCYLQQLLHHLPYQPSISRYSRPTTAAIGKMVDRAGNVNSAFYVTLNIGIL